MLLSLIIFVVMSVLAAYFATNNLDPVVVNLLGYPIRGTTGTLMVTALGIGVVLGVVMMLPAYISRSWALIRHRRKLQDLQDQQAKPPYSVDKEV
jgi:uncharacterized membrane protein YciS (DUF1049 family)